MFILTDIFYLRFTGFDKKLWFFKPTISEINSKTTWKKCMSIWFISFIPICHLMVNFLTYAKAGISCVLNITKTSLILVHLYSLFFNVFRFFQFLFQRVQTCSNMFWFWRCLSVRRHPGVVSCSNTYWNLIFQKQLKNRQNVVPSHIRCLKKRGDFFFFKSYHASLSIFLHLYTTQLKHTYLLNTRQLSTLLSNFITVDLLLLCHEKWFKSLCPRVCLNSEALKS